MMNVSHVELVKPSVQQALSPKAMASMLSTQMTASIAALAQMSAQWMLHNQNNIL